MKLEGFNYHLPKELIAQFPSQKRDESRLMVLNRGEQTIEHRHFFELTEYLQSGDILIVNNTKVIPARLFGRKTTGGAVEVFLIQKLEIRNQESEISPATSQIWRCLINPARGIKKGSEIAFEHGLKAAIIEKGAHGNWVVELYASMEIDKALELAGKMPLPPYIKRDRGSGGNAQNRISALDRERYQTIFAKDEGAIAAPTAGLHFTEKLLKKIRNLGVEILYITLHTGLGTFRPVKTEDITEHRMDPEYFKVDPVTFETIKRAKQENRRIIDVGSTVTRTLETMVKHGWEKPILSGTTDLFIYPGYRFNVADVLITNFHLPKSTLLMLTAAFAGKDFIMSAYREAVQHRYRFFSYGDAMMII